MEMKERNITEVYAASYVGSVAVLRGTCREENGGGRYKSVLCICMNISSLSCLCGFLFTTPAFTPQSSLSNVGISRDYCVECTCCVCSRECCSSCLKREDFTQQESRQERDHCSH